VKVREVEYSRLFNLENYQNERIGFRVEVGEDESADEVLGRLFFKVLQIEDGLQMYRNYIGLIELTKKQIRDYEKAIERAYENLVELENRRKKLMEEDVEESKSKMCELLDIDEMIARTKGRIEELKEKRDSALKKLKVLEERKDEIAELIKTGKFDKISSEIPDVEDEEDDFY